MAQKNQAAASKARRSKNKPREAPVVTGPNMDSLGFQAMDSNVPGLSQVILQKLNMKSYDEYRSAMEGKQLCPDFGIRSYFEMFQKMEDTFKFCTECKKLPESLPDPKSLRRCKRCQNVYYCGSGCQRVNWPMHKKFCRKLKLVAIDRLVEWLVFTGDIPFPTGSWTKRIQDVKGWDDWFSMQEQLDEKLSSILAGRYMSILWANAGKPKPDEPELIESVKRVTTDFVSRPATIGLGICAFQLDPFAKPITVHVVGASHVETLNARATDYDELSRMFPKHQGIEVVMVGVDVVDGAIMRPPLVAFGPRERVYLSSYKGLYHDFWESLVEMQQAARPDIVVGFHPGRPWPVTDPLPSPREDRHMGALLPVRVPKASRILQPPLPALGSKRRIKKICSHRPFMSLKTSCLRQHNNLPFNSHPWFNDGSRSTHAQPFRVHRRGSGGSPPPLGSRRRNFFPYSFLHCLSGFHACHNLMESWLPTLLLLRDYKIPSLFTMYSEQELKNSLKILVELETLIVGCGANPFASLKPEQAYSNPNRPPVYCSSHYVMFHGLSGPPDEPDVGDLDQEKMD